MQLKISGDKAFFKNPHIHPERHSTICPGAPAIAGIIGSVWHKPQVRILVKSIQLLNEIKYENFRISGLTKRPPASGDSAEAYARSERESLTTLLNFTYLMDVSYVVEFDFLVNHENVVDDPGCNLFAKFYEILSRRVTKGQYFKTPYLGKQNCLAKIEFPRGDEVIHQSLIGTQHIGALLADMNWIPNTKGKHYWKSHDGSGKIIRGDYFPMFKNFVMTNGKIVFNEN